MNPPSCIGFQFPGLVLKIDDKDRGDCWNSCERRQEWDIIIGYKKECMYIFYVHVCMFLSMGRGTPWFVREMTCDHSASLYIVISTDEK